jgi:hypothetical protein
MEFLLIPIALFLAFANGANDNFKGFATVWGADARRITDFDYPCVDRRPRRCGNGGQTRRDPV